jgi:hypothetical protein
MREVYRRLPARPGAFFAAPDRDRMERQRSEVHPMNQPTAARAMLALLLLLPLTGCAGLAGRRDAVSWLEARGADAMDIFGVRLGVGVGLGAWVRATEYAQLGFMFRGPGESRLVISSETAHNEDFRARGVPCVMTGTIGRYGGLWFESSREVMVPLYSNRDEAQSPIRREAVAGVVSPDGRLDDWRGSFGVGAHLLLVGAEFELRPWQIVDFLAGLAGYDPSGDDVPVLRASSAGTAAES